MTHYIAGHQANVLDISYPADRTGLARGTVHAAGIKLNHALFVGKTAKSDALIVGIIFLRLGNEQHGVKRVLAIFEHLPALIDGLLARNFGDDDRLFGLGELPTL